MYGCVRGPDNRLLRLLRRHLRVVCFSGLLLHLHLWGRRRGVRHSKGEWDRWGGGEDHNVFVLMWGDGRLQLESGEGVHGVVVKVTVTGA